MLHQMTELMHSLMTCNSVNAKTHFSSKGSLKASSKVTLHTIESWTMSCTVSTHACEGRINKNFNTCLSGASSCLCGLTSLCKVTKACKASHDKVSFICGSLDCFLM